MSTLLAGRYELIEKIGEGGMAVVYKARCRLLNRYVAIKILRPEFSRNQQFVDNFNRESQAAAGLQHPNIIAVYDVGKEGNINFIVMELVDGKPLSDIIEEEGHLDYKRAVDIARQTGSALAIAHKNNIIHRDVKPHNIMITKDGTAKLGDFGIAKAISDSTVAEGGQVMGSVHYFSPEQARGSYVDERSDIYSLGIVLFEMLTGRVPFDGDNPIQISLMHINEDVPPPSKFVSGIPPALDKVVLKATDKYQTNRYASAEEFVTELSNIEYITKMVGDKVFATGSSSKSDEESVTNLAPEGRSSKKAKKKKKVKPGVIAVSVITSIVIITAIVFGLSKLGILGSGNNVIVPDLKNMSYSEARDTLEKEGLKIKKGESHDSADVEEGKVMNQDPKWGSEVKKGSTVTVNLSSGKKEGVIPSVVGMTYDEAEISKYLKSFGFKLGYVNYEESDTVEKGKIISQSPSAGMKAGDESSVSIVVSKGKKENDTVTVPSVTGMTFDQAEKTLTAAGLKVGNVEYKESLTSDKNTVIWQEYNAGTKVNKDTAVSLQVSKGAPEANPGGGTDNGSQNQPNDNPAPEGGNTENGN